MDRLSAARYVENVKGSFIHRPGTSHATNSSVRKSGVSHMLYTRSQNMLPSLILEVPSRTLSLLTTSCRRVAQFIALRAIFDKGGHDRAIVEVALHHAAKKIISRDGW